MTLKMKLTSTICAFLLILGLTIMGVMAAPSATVNLGGSISFSSTNVYAKVTGTIEGTSSTTQPELDEIYIDNETVDGDIDTWSSQDLTFKNDGSEITISVTVENLATDRPLYVSTLDTVGKVDNVSKNIENPAFVLGEKGSGNESKTITITLNVSNKNKSLASEAIYGYEFELLDESAVLSTDDEAFENKLIFPESSYDETYHTISVVSAGVNYDGDPSENTYNLTGDVVIPAYVNYNDVICSVDTIGSFAFGFPEAEGCNLNSLTIPCTVKTILSCAFSNCTITNGIYIPDSVTTLGENAFNCAKFSTIEIPNSVIHIEGGSFNGCEAENIVLPNNGQITKIMYETFIGCDKLKTITIPNSVKEIEKNAFQSCSALTDVYFTGSEAEWDAITINETGNDVLSTATIHFNSTGV